MGLYTVEMVDPPPGWDDKMIEVRHRRIPVEKVGIACSEFLRISHELWLKAGRPGKAAPTVRVFAHGLSSFLQENKKT
jgi:hypothetical protein